MKKKYISLYDSEKYIDDCWCCAKSIKRGEDYFDVRRNMLQLATRYCVDCAIKHKLVTQEYLEELRKLES